MERPYNNFENIKEIEFNNYDKLFSLSHTDLDGYGSQLIIKTSLLTTDIEIDYVNADYNAIDEKIKYIKKQILKDRYKKYIILITDLGLDKQQASQLDEFIKNNKDITITLQLLDHHETHLVNAQKYDWYYVDINKCAAMIVYEYMKSNKKIQTNKEIEKVANLIQVYDLWQEEDKDFGKSNFLANTIFTFLPSYPKILYKHRAEHYMYVIKELTQSLQFKTVKEVQREVFDICESFYKNKIIEKYYLDENMSMEAKHDRYLFELTKEYYGNFERFILESKKYKVIYDYGPSFQNISKYILNEIGDVDFLIFVHASKKVSLRSKEDTNVASIAEDYFSGGGHKFASGGYMKLDKNEVINNQRQLEQYFREKY